MEKCPLRGKWTCVTRAVGLWQNTQIWWKSSLRCCNEIAKMSSYILPLLSVPCHSMQRLCLCKLSSSSDLRSVAFPWLRRPHLDTCLRKGRKTCHYTFMHSWKQEFVIVLPGRVSIGDNSMSTSSPLDTHAMATLTKKQSRPIRSQHIWINEVQ